MSEITTVEGIIDRSIAGLEQDQPIRKQEHPDVAEQIDDFIKKLNLLKTGKKPFTLVGVCSNFEIGPLFIFLLDF